MTRFLLKLNLILLTLPYFAKADFVCEKNYLEMGGPRRVVILDEDMTKTLSKNLYKDLTLKQLRQNQSYFYRFKLKDYTIDPRNHSVLDKTISERPIHCWTLTYPKNQLKEIHCVETTPWRVLASEIEESGEIPIQFKEKFKTWSIALDSKDLGYFKIRTGTIIGKGDGATLETFNPIEEQHLACTQVSDEKTVEIENEILDLKNQFENLDENDPTRSERTGKPVNRSPAILGPAIDDSSQSSEKSAY